ncbi:MAG: hypothetical protein IJZ95_00490 [Oscillospiraceae bacterium]|nr:hypothetical protein [Oscillospiraceae bacterium]
MKKYVVVILAFCCALSLVGCADITIYGAELFEGSDIHRIEVTSLPEGYNYLFDGAQTAVVSEYLAGLTLTSDFSENPNEYCGMTWVISVGYENGDMTTIYHFGNMFIRADDGPWYRMDYDEAKRLSELLYDTEAAE